MSPASVHSVIAQAAEGPMGLMDAVSPFMGVFFAAFFVALAATPVMRVLAVRNGIVDWPDLQRKTHALPVAYLGGVAILLGWLAGIAVCWFVHPVVDGHASHEVVRFPMSIVLGAVVVALTGVFDDIYGISPRVKVSGQLFAASALAMEDVGIRLAQTTLELTGMNPPVWMVYLLGTMGIAVFVVGGCNSLNLIDGLDGLASGVAAIACTGFLIIAAIVATKMDANWPGFAQINAVRVVMGLAIIGAILGFLPYNFNPASIFMGDAGSLLLGYLCVSSVLLFTDTPDGPKLVTAALLVFALPITDTSLAICRRLVSGKSIFSPDNGHIHHILIRRGMSTRQAVLTLYGVSIGFAALGCAMVAFELRWRYVLAVVVVMYGFIIVTAFKTARNQVLLCQQSKADALSEAEDATAHAESAAPAVDPPG